MDKLLIFVKKQKKQGRKKTLILDQKHPHLLQYSSQKEKKLRDYEAARTHFCAA